jgi:hypothetical protein
MLAEIIAKATATQASYFHSILLGQGRLPRRKSAPLRGDAKQSWYVL